MDCSYAHSIYLRSNSKRLGSVAIHFGETAISVGLKALLWLLVNLGLAVWALLRVEGLSAAVKG